MILSKRHSPDELLFLRFVFLPPPPSGGIFSERPPFYGPYYWPFTGTGLLAYLAFHWRTRRWPPPLHMIQIVPQLFGKMRHRTVMGAVVSGIHQLPALTFRAQSDLRN